jgi:hypothetical protein
VQAVTTVTVEAPAAKSQVSAAPVSSA